MTQPEPAFSEPWHAQVFALTVSLNEAGRFDWPDWASAFAQTLQRHGLDKELDGGEDYFLAWVETLESFVADAGFTDRDELHALKNAWETAYLSTPHGAPVKLKR